LPVNSKTSYRTCQMKKNMINFNLIRNFRPRRISLGLKKLDIFHTMPIKKASWKSLRQSRVRALRNKARKIILKSGLKTAAKAIKSKSAEAGETVKKAIQALDRSAKKKLIKKNTASRLKSRLMKKLNLSAK